MSVGAAARWFHSPAAANSRIFRAAVVVGGISVLVKLIATAKELTVATYFGRGDLLDAFVIAYMLPAFMVSLLASSLSAALIPTLIEVRERDGHEAAQNLFSSAMRVSVIGIAGLSLAVAASAPRLLAIVASNFSPEKLALTKKLLFWLLPVVLLNGISINCGAVLNAGGRFALAAASAAFAPGCGILALLVWGNSAGVWALALGTLAGAAVEALIVASALRRQRMHFSVRWFGQTPALRQVFAQYVPLFAAALLCSAINLVDQSMAAMLQPGSVAALSYGGRIVSVVVGITSMSVSTAILPSLSEMVARQQWASCRHTLRTYSALLAAVTVPIALAMIAFSGTIVRLLFERGAFTAADTRVVAGVQAMYAIQIPFYGVEILYVRFLLAMKRGDLVMCSAGLNLAVNIVANIVLMKRFGVAGIALATSVFYAASFVFLLYFTCRLLRQQTAGVPLSVVPAEETCV